MPCAAGVTGVEPRGYLVSSFFMRSPGAYTHLVDASNPDNVKVDRSITRGLDEAELFNVIRDGVLMRQQQDTSAPVIALALAGALAVRRGRWRVCAGILMRTGRA